MSKMNDCFWQENVEVRPQTAFAGDGDVTITIVIMFRNRKVYLSQLYHQKLHSKG